MLRSRFKTVVLSLLGRMVALALLVATMVAPLSLAQSSPADQGEEAFEVASIKPIGRANFIPLFGAGCDGGIPRIENNRFVVTTTLYALITWAYGFNKQGGCSGVSFGDYLTGGPDWVKSDKFEIQALMPAGSPTYATWQFLSGDGPKLEDMIRTLLTNRFNLKVHRETKEVPVYALVVGRGAPKLTAPNPEDRQGVGIRRGPNQSGQISTTLMGTKTSMASLALILVLETHRPVLDRTGLAGDFNFHVDFAPLDGGPDAAGPSVFTALQDQLGLRLESTRGPVEVLVIDSVERPSEN